MYYNSGISKGHRTKRCVSRFNGPLKRLQVEDRDQIGEISRNIRQILLEVEIPSDVVKAVTHYLSQFGEEHAYAVRSSATAEDLPHASFAGQQDTYLNIIGKEAIMQHISKCWASLFTDRAVIYRMQNGFDHSQVYLSVIVQKMGFHRLQGFYLPLIQLPPTEAPINRRQFWTWRSISFWYCNGRLL